MLQAANSIELISDASSVCRTCLGVSDKSLNTKIASYEGDPLQNMFEKCLPEMVSANIGSENQSTIKVF